MATYLVTGASRGIGLELTKQLLELPVSQVGKVFAVTRSDPPVPLRDLICKSPDRAIHVLAAVDETASVQKAAEKIKAILGANQGLDVLINNAGITSWTPEGMKTVPPEQMASMFDVNVTGPHRMITAFLPLLMAGSQKKVINVSSTLGSISWADNFKAPSHAYKISKSALHMLNMQYSLEFADAGFTFLCVSPGWLKTDLGGGAIADLEIDVGVKELKRIILESDKAQNGKFLNIHVPGMENALGRYDGGEVPW